MDDILNPPKKKPRLLVGDGSDSPLDKVRNEDELLRLSLYSSSYLCSIIKDLRPVGAFFKENRIVDCHQNYLKIYIVYNSLNNDQKRVFLKVLSKKAPRFLCLDAAPGTGKTFLISSLSLCIKYPILYIVYTNELKNIMAKYPNINSITNCKFIMTAFNVSYMRSRNIFTSDNLVEKCRWIIKEVSRNKSNIDMLLEDAEILILDETSVVSPLFIFLLYVIGVEYKRRIIFVGDKFQQTLSRNKFHTFTNYKLLYKICVLETLNEKMRQRSKSFHVVLDTIVSYMNNHDNCVEIPMTFEFKYLLYTLISEKFHSTETFSALFMAQFHKQIYNRMIRFKKKETNYKIIHLSKEKDNYVPIHIKNEKFLSYLILQLNNSYIYIKEAEKILVELIEIHKNYLIVIDKIKKNIYKITRTSIQNLLHEDFIRLIPKTLYQFPLRQHTSTYHAAQGLTIKTTNLELDLDCKTINSFYVGISRLIDLKQLNKIHTTDLRHLVCTLEKNDNYYYKVFNNKDNHFKLVYDAKKFDSADINCKILKDNFIINRIHHTNSELLDFFDNGIYK